MKAHYTGFEAWGDLSYNPSWDVAQGAALSAGTSAELLPVSFELVDAKFEGLVVHFGVATKRTCVELERYAHNIKKDGLKESRILENGKIAYESGLNISHHLELLNQSISDWEFRESRDAGTFVCNTLYYASLADCTDRLFIHIPMMGPEAAMELGKKIGLHFDSV